MGWLGINVDIGSMMSASIALGVAVDDTIHFLTWYREDLNRLRDRRAAIRSAYRHCAPPTIQAALISGLSLSVFVLSTFTPTQRMGWLMLSILLAGVVAELIMLPALLAGRWAKRFRFAPSAKPGDCPASTPRKPMRSASSLNSTNSCGLTHRSTGQVPRRRAQVLRDRDDVGAGVVQILQRLHDLLGLLAHAEDEVRLRDEPGLAGHA